MPQGAFSVNFKNQKKFFIKCQNVIMQQENI
jgi:hypothetical protein